MEITITLTGKAAQLFTDIQARIDATPEIPQAMTDEQIVALCMTVFKTANETPRSTPLGWAFNLAIARFQVNIMGAE